jgi:hypothetical protein
MNHACFLGLTTWPVQQRRMPIAIDGISLMRANNQQYLALSYLLGSTSLTKKLVVGAVDLELRFTKRAAS